MKIFNQTRNTILANKFSVANSAPKRMKGLLGRNSLDEKEALIIKPCNSVHTLFMRFAIDVVFLNAQDEVVGSEEFLSPWRLSPVYFKSRYVIELPAGTIRKNRLKAGDKLKF